ncbi:hypothetical protein TEA_020917 [Camellia sinensis var. sinensis]|uniref:Tryptophan synthase beta chain-like PALP domain-containing protein n=1 Tax=Camellia sinensis var. sinensis TaxID=542762 RepID=A0A4S4EG71_CAMSN|nr:hypothetical protein TEA_020917 [Camellia sinensis var. sinensis]
MLSCSCLCSTRLFSPNPIARALKSNSKLNQTQHHHHHQQKIFLCTSRSNLSVTAMEAPPQTEQPYNNSFEFDGFLSNKPYNPPSWASHLNPIPSHIFSLGHFPTPIHKWNLPNLPNNTQVWLKRDDLSGMQLSGNKVRKLEFLMADAVAQGADCIITIGGIQSNHCRATAVAAKYLNLDCYLILRTSKVLVDKDPGLTGNLLVERLVGAHIDLVSKEEYAKIGSLELTSLLKEKLVNEGRKPYVIPVGGSNSLGVCELVGLHGTLLGASVAMPWIQRPRTANPLSNLITKETMVASSRHGIDQHNHNRTMALAGASQMVDELGTQLAYWMELPTTFGGTIAGLGIGSWLSKLKAKAKGLGYAMNTTEELKFVKEIAEATGVVLDPVYSGKAVYGLMKDMVENPTKWEGRKILFIHTGGLLGLFDKTDQMMPLVGNWRKMDIHESIPRMDGTGKILSSSSRCMVATVVAAFSGSDVTVAVVVITSGVHVS